MQRRKLAAGATIATAVFAFTVTNAWAHVTVSPASAPKGSDATLTFAVPNEQDSANTVEVKMQMPPDHPFSAVAVQPVPGWTVDVQKTTLATPIQGDAGPVSEVVSTIDWKGGQIKPGEFQQFAISVALPTNADVLYFKTLQTYDNGQTVSWIEVPAPGGAEPENPAPALTLTAAEDTGSSTATTVAPETATTTATTASPSNAGATDASLAALSSKVDGIKSDADTTKNVALVGVALGAVALVAAIGAIIVARRRPSDTPAPATPEPATRAPDPDA